MSDAGNQASVWLDCDTGHDDAFAILLAAYHSRINLLGVSTTHGNAPVENTTHNTLAVLDAMGASDIPVIRGRDKPLRRDPSFAADIHGETGLDGVTLLPKQPSNKLHSESLDDVANTILEQPPNTVHLVATGPLTNIAILLKWAEELTMHIASLNIMGGAIGNRFTDAPLGMVEGEGPRFGNWSPWAEFNIYADPEAAKWVFRNRTLAEKTTLIPLDVTHLVRGTDPVQSMLFGPWKHVLHNDKKRKLSSVRSLMQEILNFFASTYDKQFGISDGPPLHDPLAVFAVIEPDKFDDEDGQRWDVDIVIESGNYHPKKNPDNHVGQTIIRRSANKRGVRIPRGVDIDWFWRTIDEVLQTAETRIDCSGPIVADNNLLGFSKNEKSPSPRLSGLTSDERAKRKASLNTWRVTAQERMRNVEMPQI